MKTYLQDTIIANINEETGICEFALERFVCKKPLKSKKTENIYLVATVYQ